MTSKHIYIANVPAKRRTTTTFAECLAVTPHELNGRPLSEEARRMLAIDRCDYLNSPPDQQAAWRAAGAAPCY